MALGFQPTRRRGVSRHHGLTARGTRDGWTLARGRYRQPLAGPARRAHRHARRQPCAHGTGGRRTGAPDAPGGQHRPAFGVAGCHRGPRPDGAGTCAAAVRCRARRIPRPARRPVPAQRIRARNPPHAARPRAARRALRRFRMPRPAARRAVLRARAPARWRDARLVEHPQRRRSRRLARQRRARPCAPTPELPQAFWRILLPPRCWCCSRSRGSARARKRPLRLRPLAELRRLCLPLALLLAGGRARPRSPSRSALPPVLASRFSCARPAALARVG